MPASFMMSSIFDIAHSAMVDMRRVAIWIESLGEDIRRGLRGAGRQPRARRRQCRVLGLGIGVNALLYMGVSTIYFHQPTIARADRVVGVEPGNANQFSSPELPRPAGRQHFRWRRWIQDVIHQIWAPAIA